MPSQLQQASFDLKPVAAPNFYIFAAAAADQGSDQRERGERDTSDDSQAPNTSTEELSPIACSAVTPTAAATEAGATLSSSPATSDRERTTPPLKMKMGPTDGPITPPSTPTRATTTTTAKRTSSSRPSLLTRTSSSKLVVYCDNDDVENTNNAADSPVSLGPTGTPRRSRRSGLLTPLEASPSSSPSALNASKGNNNQTTGLTPALNKMMKPTKGNQKRKLNQICSRLS